MITLLNLGENRSIIPILGFHGVISSKIYPLRSPQVDFNYPQKDLEKLLDYLITHNYWFLTSEDLYNFFLKKSSEIPAEHRDQKPIMLTFDDGYETVYTNLLPILQKLEKKYGTKVKVVLFINPGHLANEDTINPIHLACGELREGLKAGFFDIQSHGDYHRNLTKLSGKQIISELLSARIKLRKCTQGLDPERKVASHLAYPYGANNKKVESYVAKFYLSGYLYNDKILNYSCFKNSYKLPRIMINTHRSVQDLISIIQDFSPANIIGYQSDC